MDTPDLSKLVKTKAQARELIIRIASVSEQVFQTNFNLETALSEQFGMQKKDIFVAMMRNAGISEQKPSQIKNFLTKLQEQINALPVLSVSLAFEPTEKTLKILSDWFLLNVKRQVLFDITVDPSLIAGIAIHYNGRFLDFSVQDRIQVVIKAMLTESPTQPLTSNEQAIHQQAHPTRI